MSRTRCYGALSTFTLKSSFQTVGLAWWDEEQRLLEVDKQALQAKPGIKTAAF